VTKTVIDYTKAIPDETPSNFELRLFKAQRDGFDFVEATDEVIDFYTRGELGPSSYFDYKGVRVYKAGTRETTEQYEAITLDEKLHGGKWNFEGSGR